MKRRFYKTFHNLNYLYRIRSTASFNINAFQKDIVFGTTSVRLNDKTELHFSLDKRKFKHFLNITNSEVKKNYFKTANSNKIYKYIKNFLIPAKQTDLRYCVLISCFSKNDIRKRKDMWMKYTVQGQSENGFLLVYRKEDLINAANSQLSIKFKKYGDVSYCSKKKNDKTKFYIELMKIIMNDEISIYFPNPIVRKFMYTNQQIVEIAINDLLKKRGFNDDIADDLIYSKEKRWSSENEWRLIGDNVNFNKKSPSNSNSYGDVLICQPIAIYIRRKIDLSTKKQLINIAKSKNNMDIYLEDDNNCFKYNKI